MLEHTIPEKEIPCKATFICTSFFIYVQLELQADQYALYKAIHITYTVLEY